MICKIIVQSQLFLKILSDFFMWKLYKTPDKFSLYIRLFMLFPWRKSP